jgi:methionyl-tRNA formyltransferase
MGFVDALDVDVVFCCGWSRIVPLDMLEKYVVVGMHPTRLPDGRGGAPIPRTVLRGIQHSAVSFYVMTEDVDFGDVALQVPFDIASDADAAYVYAAVKSIVENHSGDALRNVVDGRFVVRKSEFAGSDISPQRKPRQSLVDWDRSAEDVLRFVRALSRPYPNAFAKCDGSVVRFHSPGVVCDDGIGPFSFRVDDGLVVGCGDMSVRFANEDFSCSEPIPLNGEFECNRLHGE